MSNLIIKKSKIQGNGVFSQKIFKKGEKVFKFSDKIIKIKHQPGCNCSICHRCIQVGKSIWLYPKRGSYGWNINHSCNPNCGIKGKSIVAMKKIKSNEEITIDYSTSTCDAGWKLNCGCKSKNCRKIIRSIQFLQKSLGRKYENFILPYFKKQSKFSNKALRQMQ